jgi:chloride channel protein, CIC family
MQKPKGIPLRSFAIFLLAAIIGVSGGLLGSVFQDGLSRLQQLLTGGGDKQSLSEAVREHLTWWQTLLLPVAGGFVAGCILLILRGKKPPFGVTDIIGLVQLRKGTIRLRESLVQTLSSASSIGSGGSIGREGATIQIAATVAALISRAARLSSRHRAVLLGCGVSAGMAASYNSPISAAIFVMEVVLGNFAMDVFAPIVLASVLATILREVMVGNDAIYKESAKGLATLSPSLVLAAMLLGIMCGFGSIFFRHALIVGKRTFGRLRMTPPLTLALGGLIVGTIGVFMPETWGNGFEVIETIAHSQPSVALILTLFLWKQVATVSTVGSGGLGGIFTPNLVIGAAFGGLFAHAISLFSPLTQGEQGSFVFVGMAGLCAATLHAPVTAVVLVFELTGHYELVLPVMLCSIVASITASLLDEDSYYTAALKAKGESLPSGIEDLAIRTTFVRDVLRKDCVTVRDSAGFDEVMDLLTNHRGDTIYVQSATGSLVGRIELQDVKNFINDPTLSSVVIAADLTRPVVTVSPDDSIATVMPMFEDPDLSEVAVVTTGPQPRLLGRVRDQDVLTTLGSEVLGQQRRSTRVSMTGPDGNDLSLPAGHSLVTLAVPDSWHGLAIDALPPEALRGVVVMLAIRDGANGPERVAATQDLVLQAGWQIAVLGTKEAIDRLQRDSAPADE